MNILVTGSNGFIGKNLVPFLKSRGHNVFTYDWGQDLPNYFDKLHWMIHLGAISSTTETDVEKICDQNINSSIWLIDKCAQNNVNVQFASSASVYGDSNTFLESEKVYPKTLYALSKYIVERYCYNKQNSTDIIIQCFRYFNVYGSHEDGKGNQASPFHKFKQQSIDQGYVTLFEGSVNYKRDFIDVSEVINIHDKFFNVKESGIWNIGSGSPKSFEDVAKIYSSNIKYIPMPEEIGKGYQQYTCANISKLQNTLQKINKHK
jgi:ADP-L-glycero-D-manno-heptose 6-epimerase